MIFERSLKTLHSSLKPTIITYTGTSKLNIKTEKLFAFIYQR